MPRRTRRPADLSAAEFKRELKTHGFLKLSLEGTFSDIRARGCPPIEPVMRARGNGKPGKRLDRRATLAALHAARAARDALAAASAAERERQAQIAASIAPIAMPAPRDGLEGSAAIAQLADDLVVSHTRNEGVTSADLTRMGWRRRQLDELLEPARSLAYSRQNGVAA